jgi:hypothetical protein
VNSPPEIRDKRRQQKTFPKTKCTKAKGHHTNLLSEKRERERERERDARRRIE